MFDRNTDTVDDLINEDTGNASTVRRQKGRTAKVVVTAQVEDSEKWEQGFRTHADLFRSQTVTKPITFSTIEDNQVAVCFEPEDLDAYMKVLDSPATAEAMAFDGVKRETVRVFVLDKEFQV